MRYWNNWQSQVYSGFLEFYSLKIAVAKNNTIRVDRVNLKSIKLWARQFNNELKLATKLRKAKRSYKVR